MKYLYVVALVLLLSAFFCAKSERDKSPKLVIASIDSTEKEKPKYIIPEVRVVKGDSLMFTANKIKEAATIIIPRADVLCKLDTVDNIFTVEGITYLFITLIENDKKENSKEWTSRKFLIKEHKHKSTYEYSAYINKKMKMAEGESSPKIIVDP
jgi:hypothetical protein